MSSDSEPAPPDKTQHKELNATEQQKPQAVDQGIKLIEIQQVEALHQTLRQLQPRCGRGKQQHRDKSHQQDAGKGEQRF